MAQNTNTRVSMNNQPLTRRVKIYDVTTKELLYTCDTANEAQQITGVSNVREYISKKYRCHKNNLGKIICFR